MRNASELQRVVALAAMLSDRVPTARWFAFGSSLTDAPLPSDVDIAVVCQTHEETACVRQALEPLSYEFPLDLVLLTENEDRELRFIESLPCRKLFPV